MRWTKYAAVAAVMLAVSALSMSAPDAGTAASSAAQTEPGQTQVEPQAGLFGWVGGPVRGKLARTYTTPATLFEGGWRPVPNAILSRVVAAGTTDLFNIAFSGECQVRSLGSGDTARIRIAHFVNGVQVAPIEPYDGDQRFCSAVSQVATYKGNWATRVGAGTHVVRVEIMPTDFGVDNGVLAVVIDDWTFELVVYD